MNRVHLIDLNDNDIEQILKITDLENMFTVHTDDKHNRVFNLNETLYINAAKSALEEYECKSEMHWTLLSYNIYGTTRLAWLLCKLNGVTASNIFKAKQPGDKVKYLSKEYVDSILNDINDMT